LNLLDSDQVCKHRLCARHDCQSHKIALATTVNVDELLTRPAHTEMAFDPPQLDIPYSSNSVQSLHADHNKSQAWVLSSYKTRNQTQRRPINACNTCIRMKRRCDLKKPSCSLCEKRQRSCEYPKQTQTSTGPMTEASDVHGGEVALRPPMVQTWLGNSTTDIKDDSSHDFSNQPKRSQCCHIPASYAFIN